MAEALLRRRLEQLGVAADVSSAGLLFDGRAAEVGALVAMERSGLDLSTHAARKISTAILGQADLVIVMEHQHVREVVMTEGGDLHRTYTLPDLVARAEADGPRGDEPFADWAARLSQGRTPADVVRGDASLEVGDPMGRSKRAFRDTATELEVLIDRFVAMAWPVGGRHDRSAEVEGARPADRGARR